MEELIQVNAMKLYSIFICYKCKFPYFGGENVCNVDEEDGIDPSSERLCSKVYPTKI